MFPTPSFRFSLSLLLVTVGLIYWSLALTRPPQAKPATAPLTQFSAYRAMQHLGQIAREPHAMGTSGHARLRTYLLKALQNMGLEPQIQETIVQNDAFGAASGYVYNIIARIKGQQASKAVLLMAHYDSQPNTLGAADDGAGVAAILEAVRALSQDKPLQQDVLLLLSDGEEYGLFGAKAFLRHPWAKDIGFVINLEARGNNGPSMMFEISPDNGWIIEQAAKATPHLFASSLMYEVYRRLPNNTDFTIFRDAGYAGVNSAFIDGFVHYHKLTDSPANLNLNSLQHHGENLLALTRHFGQDSLRQVKGPDKVFFNLAGAWLVQYPMALNGLWMALLTSVFVAVLVLGFRRQPLRVGPLLGGLGVYVLLLVMVTGAIWAINLIVLGWLPQVHVQNGTYSSATFFVAYALLTLGLLGLLLSLSLRWLSSLSLMLGVCGLLYGLTLTSVILLPGASFLFLFPLVSVLVGLLLIVSQRRQRLFHGLILLLTALPTLFIVMPVVKSLFVAFDLQLPLVSMLLLGLALALLLPLWLLIEPGLRWRGLPVLPAGALLVGFIMTLAGIKSERPSADQPLHSHVSYLFNTDTRQALWASNYLTADEWNRQFFSSPTRGPLTELYPHDRRTYLKNAAVPIVTPAPVAHLQSDLTTGNLRTLSLQLRSLRGAAHLQVLLLPQKAQDIKRLFLNGERVAIPVQQASGGPLYDLVLYGLPVTKQVTLTIELVAPGSLRLLLYDQSIGLPPQLVKRPRPAHIVPEQGRSSNLTVIGKTYVF